MAEWEHTHNYTVVDTDAAGFRIGSQLRGAVQRIHERATRNRRARPARELLDWHPSNFDVSCHRIVCSIKLFF